MMKTKRGVGRKIKSRLSLKEGKRKSALGSMDVPSSPPSKHDLRASTGTMGAPVVMTTAAPPPPLPISKRHSIGTAPEASYSSSCNTTQETLIMAPTMSSGDDSFDDYHHDSNTHNNVESGENANVDFTSNFHQDLLQLGNAIERLSFMQLPPAEASENDSAPPANPNPAEQNPQPISVVKEDEEKEIPKESSPRSVAMNNPFESFGSDDNLEDQEPTTPTANPVPVGTPHKPEMQQQQQHPAQQHPAQQHPAQQHQQTHDSSHSQVQHQQQHPAQAPTQVAQAHAQQQQNHVQTQAHAHIQQQQPQQLHAEAMVDPATAAAIMRKPSANQVNPFDSHVQEQKNPQQLPIYPAAPSLDEIHQSQQQLPIFNAVPSLDESTTAGAAQALQRQASSNPFDDDKNSHEQEFPFDEGPTTAIPPSTPATTTAAVSANPFDNHPPAMVTPPATPPAPRSTSSLNPFEDESISTSVQQHQGMSGSIQNHQSWNNLNNSMSNGSQHLHPAYQNQHQELRLNNNNTNNSMDEDYLDKELQHLMPSTLQQQNGLEDEKNMDDDYLLNELHHVKLSQSQQDHHAAMNGSMRTNNNNKHPPVMLQSKSESGMGMAEDYLADELHHVRRSMSMSHGGEHHHQQIHPQHGLLGGGNHEDEEEETETHSHDEDPSERVEAMASLAAVDHFC